MRLWIPVLLFSLVMVMAGGTAFAGGQEDLIAKGEILFNNNCARCHGVKGVGTDKGPPFINKIYRPSHHDDMAFRIAAWNGVRAHHWRFGNMPKVEGVGMADMGMIIKYIRAIQKEAGVY